MSDGGMPPAVLDHGASPTQIYCTDCAYSTEIDDEHREDLDESQVGGCLICDGCGRDISELVDGDAGTREGRGGR